tara:strand:- start:142008 stop:142841 length:834 start_codon:yes stop_codon:yes gene_type:complete
MKKITSKKIGKKLASYGALSAAILGVADASGQIIYTDVDPDEVLTGTRFLLDLNGDSTVDYEISNDGVFSGVTPGTTARVYTSNSSSILGMNAGGNYNYPFALNEGDPISSGGTTWITNSNYQTLNWMGCAYTNSQWCDGQVDKYLGLRITVGSDMHYGWVRLDIPADASSITVKDYAFNSVAGEPIDAGDQGVIVGLEDQIFEGFTQFVDANKNLQLSAATTMERIVLHNILGQQVITKDLNSQNETVSLAALKSNIYIATVTIDGRSKSFKLVVK